MIWMWKNSLKKHLMTPFEFENEMYIKDIVYYSWGMPLIMQQIGDAIFWNLETKVIGEDVTYDGIKDAAQELHNKLLKTSLNKIKNPQYNKILLKLGENEKFNFNVSELSNFLNDNEKNILNEFLDKMISIGILENVDDEFESYELLILHISFIF